MKVFTYYLLNRAAILCLLIVFCSLSAHAQKVDSTKEVTAKHPKATKVVNGILYGLSFLHYSDRKKDRILDGPEDFEQYRGKTIRSIRFKTLRPYGVSIDHPDTVVKSKLSKFANSIHILTKSRVLKNEMLIKEGDKLDPQLMSDMERNIWNRDLFKDQRLQVEVNPNDTNSVDFTLLTQDLWSWNVVNIFGAKSSSIGIEFKNFMGVAQSWNNYVSLNYRKDNLWSFSGSYKYKNIASSQINASLNYIYDNFNKGMEAYVGRIFVSSKMNWAGYAYSNIYKQSAKENNFLASTIPTNVIFNAQAAWLARAYSLPFHSRKDPNMAYKFIISAKFNRLNYLQRPFVRNADNSLSFVNGHSFLVGIGLARWDYFTEQNVNKLVETEFFTKGVNFGFLSGLSNEEEVGSRYYEALVGAYGFKVPHLGYFALRAKCGTYIKHEKYENLVLNSSLLFYSDVLNLGKKLFFRQFVRAGYNQGWNFAQNQDLYLNDGNGGVRGIFLSLLRGQRTFSFSFEPNFYAKFKVLGFTGNLFGFADIAMAGSGDGKYFNNLIQGYGAGIRVRNLKLGIDYFDITFAYYPNLNKVGQKNWNALGNFRNQKNIGNYEGTLYDSKTMIFQNAPIDDADY